MILKTCFFCLEDIANHQEICTNCQDLLPWHPKGCQACANIFIEAKEHIPASPYYCGACIAKRPNFDEITACFSYVWPIDDLIYKMKFGREPIIAHLLGKLLTKSLPKNHKVNAIVPVPLHSNRQQQRGFNQALEIAKTISKITKIPIANNLVKTKDTQAQATVRNIVRRKSINSELYKIAKPIPFSHIAIVDDVVTTATTVNNIAKQLKLHGVKKISVWTSSRAVFYDNLK